MTGALVKGRRVGTLLQCPSCGLCRSERCRRIGERLDVTKRDPDALYAGRRCAQQHRGGRVKSLPLAGPERLQLRR